MGLHIKIKDKTLILCPSSTTIVKYYVQLFQRHILKILQLLLNLCIYLSVPSSILL